MTTPPTAATATVLDGRFHIKRKISQGAQGTVFEAFDAATSAPVAIKYLSAKAPGYHESALRLEAEYGALAKLSTVRDVVNALGFERRAHGTYLVLEWVAAPDAAAVLRARGPLDLQTFTWVARALLGALAEAHMRHILHCDVKPQNLLLGRDVFKLIDFGIAENAGFVLLADKPDLQGTLPYLPPERALGMLAAPAGDVFSAGVTLFELLTGKLPFEGEPGEMQRRKMTGEMPKVTAYNPDAPAWLNAWFARMLAPQPEQRFAGAREALAALNADAAVLTPSLQSLLRACAECNAELWRDIPFCTHCGRPYEVRPAPGAWSVVIWKAESKPALIATYQALTGRRLSSWRKGLFLAEYPRVLLHDVDEATAHVAVAALGGEDTSLTISKTPYRELMRHLRLSTIQQATALAAVASLFIFLFLYVSRIGSTGSAAMGPALWLLCGTAGAALGYVALSAALPLVPGEHLRADQKRPVAKPLIQARQQLQALTTAGGRAKASRLVRRVQEVHAFVAARRLAPELKQEFTTRLGGALQHALQALRVSEERTHALKTLRAQGVRKQRAALQELARAETDKQALDQLLKRIQELSAAEQALNAAEADVARAESDYANAFSGVNALYLISRAGNDDALRQSAALLPGETPPAGPSPERFA